ncbi:hypothetical protein MKI84_04620 [Ancylobacter sp. A5.8]|uniref:hypothetical protein n=1 Tax=Ancylobacter gelatini TaxID=2919920 RepID=UPI001F4D8F0C|nr:hypothetical protein [Ancylobacter gelatini]MCJ8142192.1 hypothetical protein [Ancylobacter gelatini]
MTKRNEDREPDYLRRLGRRARLGDVLLVEGTLCALAVSLLVFVPALADKAPPHAPPALQATYRVCTPVFAAGDDDEPAPAGPGIADPSQPSCAGSARPLFLVQEARRQDSAHRHSFH